MAVAAFVVSCLAFCASAWAAWYARATSAATARQAGATEAQAVSTAAQAEYTRRLLELDEERASREHYERSKDALVAQRMAFMEPPSPWVVSWDGKNSFKLTNGGFEPMLDVSLEFDIEPAAIVQRSWPRIDARATVKVQLVRAMGASPDDVTVRWRSNTDGPIRQWTTALP